MVPLKSLIPLHSKSLKSKNILRSHKSALNCLNAKCIENFGFEGMIIDHWRSLSRLLACYVQKLEGLCCVKPFIVSVSGIAAVLLTLKYYLCLKTGLYILKVILIAPA